MSPDALAGLALGTSCRHWHLVLGLWAPRRRSELDEGAREPTPGHLTPSQGLLRPKETAASEPSLENHLVRGGWKVLPASAVQADGFRQ